MRILSVGIVRARDDSCNNATRRQDKPRLFARNGSAVVAVRTRVLVGQHTVYGADTRGLVVSREQSLDIDDAFDLEVAELLMAARGEARAT